MLLVEGINIFSAVAWVEDEDFTQDLAPVEQQFADDHPGLAWVLGLQEVWFCFL